jgi:hypothetical protein
LIYSTGEINNYLIDDWGIKCDINYPIWANDRGDEEIIIEEVIVCKEMRSDLED